MTNAVQGILIEARGNLPNMKLPARSKAPQRCYHPRVYVPRGQGDYRTWDLATGDSRRMP